ncbi:MAG TPA: hypothetical protein VD978_22625 [Azospirillum sp.]|nr:hypothetical protein [Azospirillum sp.]
MGRVAVAAAVAVVAGAALASAATSEAIDPRSSPVTFGDSVYGGPRPDELRLLELGGMSTFTARYLRNEGQTIVLYSRAGEGEFVPKHSTPSEVRERFIPPGGFGRSIGAGTTLGSGRVYEFERYEMNLFGHFYGCFVATSVAQDDVLVVNQCRTDPAVPEEAEVAAALGRLRVVQPVRPAGAVAQRGGKRI